MVNIYKRVQDEWFFIGQMYLSNQLEYIGDKVDDKDYICLTEHAYDIICSHPKTNIPGLTRYFSVNGIKYRMQYVQENDNV